MNTSSIIFGLFCLFVVSYGIIDFISGDNVDVKDNAIIAAIIDAIIAGIFYVVHTTYIV